MIFLFHLNEMLRLHARYVMRSLEWWKDNISVKDAIDLSVMIAHPSKSKSIHQIIKTNCIECVGTVMFSHKYLRNIQKVII